MPGRALMISTVLALAACGSSELDSEQSTAPDAGAGGDDSAGGESGASGSLAGGAGGESAASGSPAGGAGGAAGEAGAGGAGPATMAPDMLHLEGSAASQPNADGQHIECSFYGDIVDLTFDAQGSFSGVAVGELFRRAFVDGNLVSEFAPLIGGESTLTRLANGSVELRFVGDQPDDALPFWLSLEVITGKDQGNYHYAGSWTCAPGLLGDPGFQDFEIDAEGTWTLEPP